VQTNEPTLETNQLTFLLYLLLGQVVLLGLWALVRRRGPVGAEASAGPASGRLRQIGFAVYWLLGQVALFVGWVQLVDIWEGADAVVMADVVVALHFGFVLFVVGLELLILIGWPLGWRWTRNFWLRLLHLVCIEIVVGQAVVALECPLASVERDLRGPLRPGEPGDADLPEGHYGKARLNYLEGASPMARFCHNMVFHSIPKPMYRYVVTPFGLLVLLTWVGVPPRTPGQSSRSP
jgi:Protein of Unknown function (DUF2784)